MQSGRRYLPIWLDRPLYAGRIDCCHKILSPLMLRTSALKLLLAALFMCPDAALQAHHFLWRVSGEHDFYLFGTIHLPDPRVTDPGPEVERALQDSTAFYGELDLSESNSMQITQSMWLPKHETLHDLLPESLQAQISEYIQNIHPELNLEFFAKQKIWVLAITLTVLEQQLKYPQHVPLDRVLFEKARRLGLQTGGLETIQGQLSIFESLSIQQQITFLSDTLEFLEQQNNLQDNFIEKSLQAYMRGDIDILMNHLIAYMRQEGFYAALLDALINKRNHSITQTITALADRHPEEKFFFAVGAGHFWGETGINRLLEARGYIIELID